MMRTLAFSMVLALSVIGAHAQANSQQQRIDPFFKPVTASFKNTPLPDAVETLLRDSGLSHTFTELRSDPSGYNVTAVFKSVPLESALSQTLKATGMQYKKLGEYITIYDPQWQSSQSSGYGGYRGEGFGGGYGGFDSQQPAQSVGGKQALEKVTTNYINPATIIPLAQADPGLQIANSGTNWLVINGNDASRKQFREIVRSLDTPNALLRSIYVTCSAEITSVDANGKKDSFVVSTSSTGLEGTRMPLLVTGRTVGNTLVSADSVSAAATKPDLKGLELNVTLTPVILNHLETSNTSTQTISLTGHGAISGRVPVEFSKEFDLAASVSSVGDKVTIAQGTVDLSGCSVSFTISVSARISKGGKVQPALVFGNFIDQQLQNAIQQDLKNRQNTVGNQSPTSQSPAK